MNSETPKATNHVALISGLRTLSFLSTLTFSPQDPGRLLKSMWVQGLGLRASNRPSYLVALSGLAGHDLGAAPEHVLKAVAGRL